MSSGFDFNSLGGDLLARHPFYKELEAFRQLRSLGYSQKKLQSPGVSQEHLRIFVDNYLSLNILVDRGFTIQLMASLPIDRLKWLFDKSQELSTACNFFTVNQLLGIDHTPKALPDRNNWPKTKADESSLQIRNFKVTRSGQKTIITQVKNGQTQAAEYNERIVEGEEKNRLDAFFKNRPPSVTYLNDWHCLESENQRQTYYCPRLSLHCSVSKTLGFSLVGSGLKDPIDDLTIHRERDFQNTLQSEGTHTAALLAKPGFTREKMQILASNSEILKFFAQKGIKLEDYAQVDEERLAYVFAHRLDDLKTALEFSDVFEMLALRSTSPLLHAYGSRRMPTPEIIEDEEENTHSCMLI